MTTYQIKLAAHGYFEIPALNPCRGSLRVGINPDYPKSPWVVMHQDEMGVKWSCIRMFADLDQALTFAVGEALAPIVVEEFEVVMRCGNTFRRPGRLSAEVVLSNWGWIYVTEFEGYGVLPFVDGQNKAAATNLFKEILDGTTIELGEVDGVHDGEQGDFTGSDGWCATYYLPYHGFIHKDDVLSEADNCFRSEGVFIVPNSYSFNCRLNEKSSADVIDLDARRSARLCAA